MSEIKKEGMFAEAKINDLEELVALFWSNLESAPEYISHGEIQMGVATAPGVLAHDGENVWREYIRSKIEGGDSKYPSTVIVYRENESISAFCVLEIADDGAQPFGTICDLLVRPGIRGKGLGGRMLDKAKEWFSAHGINDVYLESGLNNHSAHSFFERHGFRPVSYVFKLF